MVSHSNRVIISEPIKNLSNNKYIGFFAKKSANAGNGEEEFRFTEKSFLDMLNHYSKKLSFNYNIVEKNRDILVVLER